MAHNVCNDNVFVIAAWKQAGGRGHDKEPHLYIPSTHTGHRS